MLKMVLIERPELSEDNESIKTLAYQKWIEAISDEFKIEINPNDIIGNFIYFYKKMKILLYVFKINIHRLYQFND